MSRHVQWSGDSRRRESNSSSSQNSYSDRSSHSHSTAPTEYSRHRPRLQRPDTCYPRLETTTTNDLYDDYEDYEDPRESFETYASTVELDDQISELDGDESYDLLPPDPEEEYRTEAIPTRPQDFGSLFPSTSRISIRHDDATLDGNMNLRLDTQVEMEDGRKQPMTLFHLRMQDLKSRDFSFRRYCRDSGREICHSMRKYHTSPVSRRGVGLQRSLSSALSPLRRLSGSGFTGDFDLKRTDSGYGSMFGNDNAFFEEPKPVQYQSKRPTDSIKLEFSNYAHVEVTRSGAKAGKRYEFEYWGVNYAWKRHVKQQGDFAEVSWHLFRHGQASPLAHIVPVPLTRSQVQEETLKGGWIPPCSLWIKDEQIIQSEPDVADVVVATGLIALVDDTIKRKWPSQRNRHFALPVANASALRMQYVGPKRLIDEVFHRPGSSHQNSYGGMQSPTRTRRGFTA